MTLRERLLDAMIDGQLGRDLVVTRAEFMEYFATDNPATTGVFLSNSEMVSGARHSPTYTHFTQRIQQGTYRILPGALAQRMSERKR